jgi:prolipoprotein diacylglyceryl transferase
MSGAVLASIPSPSDGTLGPLHMYGLMIALGVLAAVELARARWRATGGDPDDIYAIALWAVPAGLIGARLYHLITDWKAYEGRWGDAIKVWEGGLGIPGGIAAGVAVGIWVAHRRGMRLSVGIDAIIPALPLAQAIGRIGNWWNQEVFGRPTSLPWGLEIDVAHRPVEYVTNATFHPTFLYEMLWNLGLMAVLILIDRRKVLRPGNILPLYVGGYFLGRLWVEALRADDASTILGLRVNLWLSIIGIVGAGIALAIRGLRRRPDDSDEPYRDGHRFDPDHPDAVVDPGEAPDAVTDEATDDASGAPGAASTSTGSATSAPAEPPPAGQGA